MAFNTIVWGSFVWTIDLNNGDAVIPNFAMWPMNDRLFYGTCRNAEVWVTGRFKGIPSFMKHHKLLHSDKFMHWLMRNVQMTPKQICVQHVRVNGQV
eukprot:13383730-Ditylum_brightwellii.AAC.1